MDLIRRVESSNDILYEFLKRLPLKLLVKLMVISKKWNRLIMDPIFIETYDSEQEGRRRQILDETLLDDEIDGSEQILDEIKLLGFIECNTKFLGMLETPKSWVPKHNFLAVDEEGHAGNFPLELGYFISASNGLVLCGCLPTSYHVVNPITKKCVSLPPPPLLNDLDLGFKLMSVGLLSLPCMPEDGNDYAVILAGSFTEAPLNNLVIYIYSSVSGEWTESVDISNFKISILSNFDVPPVFIKHDFHWFTKERDIIIYGYFCLSDECNPQLVNVPIATEEMILWRTDNGKTLWLGTSSYDSFDIFSIPIAEYKREYVIDKDEWTLIYKLDMNIMIKDVIGISREDDKREDGLIKARRHTRKLVKELYVQRDYVSLLSAHMISDPPRLLLVMRHRERIFLYDFERVIVYELQLKGRRSFTDFEWKWYPYFGTLPTLSSYIRDKNFKIDQTQH